MIKLTNDFYRTFCKCCHMNWPAAAAVHQPAPDVVMDIDEDQPPPPGTEPVIKMDNDSLDASMREPVDVEQSNFVLTKANEKKDKKSKKAEEKHKAGISSTVRPKEQIVAMGNINDLKEEEKFREVQKAVRRQQDQMDDLAKLQEDQKLKLEREELIRIQQKKLSKPAPWAKEETSTLQENQRLDYERERKERQAREVQEARMREEQRWLEEQEPAKRQAKIQAEEARQEQEMETKSTMVRSKQQMMEGNNSNSRGAPSNSNLGRASNSNKSTWAGKTAANTPALPSQTHSDPGNTSDGSSSAAVVALAGFWDHVTPDTPGQMKEQVFGANANNNNNSKKKNWSDEEQQVNNRKKKAKDEFEKWCSRALSDLQAQDIPNFLGLLMDIESPYDVSILLLYSPQHFFSLFTVRVHFFSSSVSSLTSNVKPQR